MLLNARSVNNKIILIQDLTTDEQTGLAYITEPGLGEESGIVLSDATVARKLE